MEQQLTEIKLAYYISLYVQFCKYKRMFCAHLIQDNVVKTDEEADVMFNRIDDYVKYDYHPKRAYRKKSL